MNTCHVLRCQNQAASIFVLLKEPFLEAAVCPEHNTRLEAGDQWMLDADSGILMDSDVPPAVVECTLGGGLLAGKKGVSLNFELKTPNGPRSQTVWLSTDDADQLGELLTTRRIR